MDKFLSIEQCQTNLAWLKEKLSIKVDSQNKAEIAFYLEDISAALGTCTETLAATEKHYHTDKTPFNRALNKYADEMNANYHYRLTTLQSVLKAIGSEESKARFQPY